MNQAEELLNSLPDGDVSSYLIGDEPHIIVNSDRTIVVPDELKFIAVQFDNNVETVTFDCPRYWDGHDFSKMHAYINYMRPDGYKDQYLVKNLRVDDSDDNIIHFEWTISKNVTPIKGNISFLVCIKTENDEPHWNSRLNRDLIIEEGLECYEQIVATNPDIIEEILIKMEELELSGGGTVTPEQIASAVEDYMTEHPGRSGFVVSDTPPEDKSVLWIDTSDNSGDKIQENITTYVKPTEVPLESCSQYILYGSEGGTISVQVGSNENNKVEYQFSTGFDTVWFLYAKTSDSQGSIITTSGTRKVINFEGDSSKMKISSTIPNWIVLKIS